MIVISQWIIALALSAILLLITLVIAPYRLWKQKKDILDDLTTHRLDVELGEPYRAPENVWSPLFQRLKVINPTGKPIGGCYGDLVSLKPILPEPSDEPSKVTKEYAEELLSKNIPPSGHQYPWSWTKGRLIETIPGNHGHGHLYILSHRDHANKFTTPTEDGEAFGVVGVGDYELIIEVGSREHAFPQRRCRVVFSAGSHRLFIKSFQNVVRPDSDKAEYRNLRDKVRTQS